jgi:hypothetical protein
MKSKPVENINYSFYTLKWQQAYSTSHLTKHINQHHAADFMYDKESASEAQSSTQQRKITDSRVPGMSRTHRDALTKDLVLNLVFEDKEPFSIFERPGYQKCIERLNPAYMLTSRHTVAEVTDQIAEECCQGCSIAPQKEVVQPSPKPPRTGFFNALHEDGPPVTSLADSWHELDVAIDAYRKMLVRKMLGFTSL